MAEQNADHYSEAEKIRYYVMNLIYRNGNRSIKVASTRELAEQFGVARNTVREAVEKMTREKYLITKRGIGTFTNPARSFRFSTEAAPPLIGVKLYDGGHFYYDPPLARSLAHLLNALAKQGFNFRLLSGSCNTAGELCAELELSHVDAVVGYGCAPDLIGEAAKLIPALNIGNGAKAPASSIRYNEVPAARQLAESLLKRHPRPLLLWSAEVGKGGEFRAELERDSRLEHIIWKTGDGPIDPEKLPRLPDCILPYTNALPELRRMLDARGVPPEACPVILHTRSPLPLPYTLLRSPREEACNRAAVLLAELLKGDDTRFEESFDSTLQTVTP